MTIANHIQILAPSRNEIFDIGSTIQIKWYHTSLANTVSIWFTTDGANYTQITASTTNNGVYNWDTTGLSPSTNYNIRIQSFLTTLTSDEKFTLQTKEFTNLYPSDSGISINQGERLFIKFDKTRSIGGVTIQLVKGSSVNATLATNIKTNSFEYDIPTNQTIGSDYKIKIIDSADANTNILSSNTFSIIALRNLAITNASVIQNIDTNVGTHTISWATTGAISNVNIYLLKNNKIIETIAYNITNTNSFVWNVNNKLEIGSYKICVKSSDNAIISEQNFNIFVDSSLKANLSGANFTGDITTTGDIRVDQGYVRFGNINNNDAIYSDGTNLNILMDDSEVVLFKDTETRFENPIKIKEQASANADNGARGQIWVKNDTPNNLYFTNDAGNDVQITNGASLAGGGSGGSALWCPQWSQRYYTYADRWISPSTTYGASYYQWNKINSSSLLTTWLDSNNPVIVVPRNCTLNSYALRGRATSSETYQLALLTGTPSYGSAGDTSLTQIGSTQTTNATANIQSKLEETSLTVSLSRGDILIPMLRRTTNTSATYKFWYSVFTLEATFG